MNKNNARMHIVVKDMNLQSRIHKIMEDQEISHEQLLERYLKLPHEGDLNGLHKKYEQFTKFTKKHIVKSKDVNDIELLMSHIWAVIANVVEGVYDSQKVSEAILLKIENRGFMQKIDTEAAFLKMSDKYSNQTTEINNEQSK